jgi:hypothetical protein
MIAYWFKREVLDGLALTGLVAERVPARGELAD